MMPSMMEAWAIEAMKLFAKETGSDAFTRRHRRHDLDTNRFAFTVYRGNRTCLIDMPGSQVIEHVTVSGCVRPWHEAVSVVKQWYAMTEFNDVRRSLSL